MLIDNFGIIDIHRHCIDICSYLQVFFYYKSVFSQFRLGGWVMK
jgi:hypothetical protein